MKFFKWFAFTLAVMVFWLVVNVVSTKQGWFSHAIAPLKNNSVFMEKTKKSIHDTLKGNVVMLLIENGNIIDEYTLSKGESVNRDSIFGVSSLGKWVAAMGIMTLVEQGRLDLDKPVSVYLTRWQLPKSQFDNSGVTIRRLLSHTAGITDGLGHNGFATRGQVQPLTDHLTRALDGDEGADGRVMVGIQPGSKFQYSGGSYNLLQLIVEEVSGMSFEDYMTEAVFTPLGMNSTSYRHDNVENLAQYFDENGEVRAYPFYTSLAATGLYSSANDLHKLVRLHLPVQVQESSSNPILSQLSLKEMRTPHASNTGIDIWGLGVMLFAPNNDDDFIIGHGGSSPSLNASMRLNPSNGNAIIVLETGNKFLAADTATQWTLWETGNPDIYMLKNMIPVMLSRVLIGCVLIFIVSLIIAWRRRG